MAAHKRTEITVETDRVLIIRRSRSIRGWCPACSCEVDMVGLREAEAVTGLTGTSVTRPWPDRQVARCPRPGRRLAHLSGVAAEVDVTGPRIVTTG